MMLCLQERLSLNIFLSYGHDANTRLAERLRHDLQAAGHTVWIDTAEIKAGDDWRRAIMDGVKDSDWTLALLSKHSTRDPGVCLDEIGIAIGEKGGAIATILVEAEAEVSPPVTIGHIQWLDMHDWAARAAADPAAFETWYAERLRDIRAMLDNPAVQRFAGEVEVLRDWLRPAEQAADIAPLIAGFVGRKWLLERLEAWRLGEPTVPIFWIAGAPGMGKSAFAAELAHRNKANVIGLNLCQYNLPARRDPSQVIRTLAFQAAARLVDYRRLLLDQLRRDPTGEALARRAPADLFDQLLAQPLHRAIDGGRRHGRLVLVLDALDETMGPDGRSELAELLAEQAHRLPPWVALVVTSRPETALRQQFSHLTRHDIAGEAAANRADLRLYAQGWLAVPGREAGETAALVERVTAAAEGNMLYLRTLREGVERAVLDLSAPGGLPPGLVGLYLRWFRRQFQDVTTYEREVMPLLEMLAASENPVPEDVLDEALGWSARRKAATLESLGGLFERRVEGWAPFHKSVRDWLGDREKAGKDFVVDVAAGRARLLEVLWGRFTAKGGAVVSGFLLAELPGLLRQTAERHLSALTRAGDPQEASRRASLLAEEQERSYRWPAALAWWEACGRLAVASESEAWRGYAAQRTGDVYCVVGLTVDALAAYRASMAIAERLAASDPENAGSQRDLFTRHNNIGVVLAARGSLSEALAAFRAGMAIARRLALAHPGNAEFQHDLSISHRTIGSLLFDQGDLAAALTESRSSMSIRKGLTLADPENTFFQRSLAFIHDQLGEILRAQGESAAALREYHACMVIIQLLVIAAPQNYQLQCDLSYNHDRIAEMLQEQWDFDAALKRYRMSLDIRQFLALSDPDNAGWHHNVVGSHFKIGYLLYESGKLVDALKEYRTGLALAQTLVALDSSNFNYQRDFFFGAGQMSVVAVASGDSSLAIFYAERAVRLADNLERYFPDASGRAKDLKWARYLLEMATTSGASGESD